MPYTLRGQVFTCNEYQRLPSGKCPIETGEQVLRLYHLDGNAGLNLLALALCAIVYRAVAYLLLKAKRSHWGYRGWFGKGSQRT